MTESADRPASPTLRLTAAVLVSLVAIIVLGSSIATIEIVARGQGRVLPTTRVQVVQPQADGKITDILVAEGQSVSAGDTLVVMDRTAVESDIRRIEANVARQQQDAAVARSIIAPLAGVNPANPGFVATGGAEFRRIAPQLSGQDDGAPALVEAILQALRDQVMQHDAQLNRLARGQDAQMARLERARAASEIAVQRFASAETLRRQGNMSQFDYLERLRERTAIEAEVSIAERELEGLSAEADAMTRQRASTISSALSAYRKQLAEAEILLRILEAELAAAKNRLANLSLRAPTTGRVEKLSVFTVGGFVAAGSTLMSIVPNDDRIEIEAFFDNRDIGFIEKGQRAFVKLDAFPAERYGIVHGTVVNVGADARGDVTPGKWVYAVRLQLDRNSIQVLERNLRFAPGMTATIDIITGRRRLISYFFEPIIKAFQDGLRER